MPDLPIRKATTVTSTSDTSSQTYTPEFTPSSTPSREHTAPLEGLPTMEPSKVGGAVPMRVDDGNSAEKSEEKKKTPTTNNSTADKTEEKTEATSEERAEESSLKDELVADVTLTTEDVAADKGATPTNHPPPPPPPLEPSPPAEGKVNCKKHADHDKKRRHRKGKKKAARDESASSSSSSSSSASESGDDKTKDNDSDSDSSSSDDERDHKRKKKQNKQRRLKERRGKRRSKRAESSSSSSSDSDDSSSEEEVPRRSKKRSSNKRGKKGGRKLVVEESDESDSDSFEDEPPLTNRRRGHRCGKNATRRHRRIISPPGDPSSDSTEEEHTRRRHRTRVIKTGRRDRDRDRDRGIIVVESSSSASSETSNSESDEPVLRRRHRRSGGRGGGGGGGKGSSRRQKDDKRRRRAKQKTKAGGVDKPQFWRADELWDRKIHAYRLQETAETVEDDEFGDYCFIVRRRFDWDGKHVETVVDIKSKALRTALQHQKAMGTCKSVSLAEDTPTIDPNMLFLYLEDIRAYRKELKHKGKSDKKKKARRAAREQAAQLKCLLKYLDTDFAATKKTLYPLLEAGNITFELLWTLFRSDTMAYSTTYAAEAEPRAFKVEYATKEQSFMKGVWYEIEGRYMDFDGKTFGLGSMAVEIDAFKGPRRINSLPCYPLKYHKDADGMRTKLIERGRKFTELAGQHYKYHKGLGFIKRKQQIVRVNSNGRVMVDPATFRRINPNYIISTLRAPETEFAEGDGVQPDSDCSCEACQNRGGNGEADGSGNAQDEAVNAGEEAADSSARYRVVKGKDGSSELVEIELDADGNPIPASQSAPTEEGMDRLPGDDAAGAKREFTDEELLIASPVVLGFAFTEKLWLEFTVSGIAEVEFDGGAFDSLVLPESQKSIVRALVQSHTSGAHSAKNIDDIIRGKGKGLVAVLHGTPGVGKSLTAESVSEFVKKPLYSVSAGELGTNPRDLEHELTKILDIAHCWQAVLLLDEADIFLEARTLTDIHRNALVSIFLRQLEYFQGILFLTTNRVSSFDDAIQSRIHVALRYQELDFRARRSVFAMFIKRVQAVSSTAAFGDADLDRLARKPGLNGRQIKNSVRSAQALALHEGAPLSMAHIEKVLDVAEAFERDLKGGSGYMDAMRSYT